MSSGRLVIVGILAWVLLVNFLVGGIAGWPGVVAVHAVAVGVVLVFLRRWAHRYDQEAIGVPDPAFTVVRKSVDRGRLPADETLWPAARALVDHRRTVVRDLRWIAGCITTCGSVATASYLVDTATRGGSFGRVVILAVGFAGLVTAVLVAARREAPVLDKVDRALGGTPSIVPPPPPEPPDLPQPPAEEQEAEEPAGSYVWPPGTAEFPGWDADPAAGRPPAPSWWPEWTAETPEQQPPR